MQALTKGSCNKAAANRKAVNLAMAFKNKVESSRRARGMPLHQPELLFGILAGK